MPPPYPSSELNPTVARRRKQKLYVGDKIEVPVGFLGGARRTLRGALGRGQAPQQPPSQRELSGGAAGTAGVAAVAVGVAAAGAWAARRYAADPQRKLNAAARELERKKRSAAVSAAAAAQRTAEARALQRRVAEGAKQDPEPRAGSGTRREEATAALEEALRAGKDKARQAAERLSNAQAAAAEAKVSEQAQVARMEAAMQRSAAERRAAEEMLRKEARVAQLRSEAAAEDAQAQLVEVERTRREEAAKLKEAASELADRVAALENELSAAQSAVAEAARSAADTQRDLENELSAAQSAVAEAARSAADTQRDLDAREAATLSLRKEQLRASEAESQLASLRAAEREAASTRSALFKELRLEVDAVQAENAELKAQLAQRTEVDRAALERAAGGGSSGAAAADAAARADALASKLRVDAAKRQAKGLRLRDEVSGAARVADLDATGGKAFDLRAEIAARVQGLMKKQDDIK